MLIFSVVEIFSLHVPQMEARPDTIAVSAYLVAGCLLEICSSLGGILSESWTTQAGGHSYAQCAEASSSSEVFHLPL